MPYVCANLYLPDELIATLRTRVNRTPKGNAIRGLVNEFNAAALGVRRGDARVFLSSARASRTLTCTEASVSADDTVTVGGTALTAKTSPSTTSQFAIGSSNSDTATALAACINAHTTINKFCFAVVTAAATGVVTIYAIVPGPIGNFITIAKSGSGFAIGSSGTTLAGGTSDAVKEYQLGYSEAGHLAG